MKQKNFWRVSVPCVCTCAVCALRAIAQLPHPGAVVPPIDMALSKQRCHVGLCIFFFFGEFFSKNFSDLTFPTSCRIPWMKKR